MIYFKILMFTFIALGFVCIAKFHKRAFEKSILVRKLTFKIDIEYLLLL